MCMLYDCSHTHTHTHTHTYTHTHTHTYSHTHARTHTHTHIHARTRTHTYTHTHIHTHTHTHTHTHRHPSSSSEPELSDRSLPELTSPVRSATRFDILSLQVPTNLPNRLRTFSKNPFDSDHSDHETRPMTAVPLPMAGPSRKKANGLVCVSLLEPFCLASYPGPSHPETKFSFRVGGAYLCWTNFVYREKLYNVLPILPLTLALNRNPDPS